MMMLLASDNGLNIWMNLTSHLDVLKWPHRMCWNILNSHNKLPLILYYLLLTCSGGGNLYGLAIDPVEEKVVLPKTQLQED